MTILQARSFSIRYPKSSREVQVDQYLVLWIQHPVSEVGFNKSEQLGQGWSLMLSMAVDEPKTDLYFAAANIVKKNRMAFSGEYVTQWRDDSWIRDAYAAVDTRSISKDPRTVDLSPIPSDPMVSMADMIVFDRMWPVLVRLMKAKKELYSESWVKL